MFSPVFLLSLLFILLAGVVPKSPGFLTLCGETEREELWCVDVEILVFEAMTGYFTMWYCIKTNVMKMSYKKVKNRNQNCSIY